MNTQPSKQFPGKINYLEYHGCFAVEFREYDAGGARMPQSIPEQMNEFFTRNNGALVVSVNYYGISALVLYTITLDEDALQIIRDRGEAVEKLMAEAREKRDEARRKNDEAAAAQEKRTHELVAKGMSFEIQEKEIERQRKELQELKRRIKKGSFEKETKEKLLKDLVPDEEMKTENGAPFDEDLNKDKT